MRDNFKEMLISRVRLPPVVVVDGDVRGPVVIKIEVSSANGYASAGMEKEGEVRRR